MSERITLDKEALCSVVRAAFRSAEGWGDVEAGHLDISGREDEERNWSIISTIIAPSPAMKLAGDAIATELYARYRLAPRQPAPFRPMPAARGADPSAGAPPEIAGATMAVGKATM